MKRCIGVVLGLMLVFSLSGCSGTAVALAEAALGTSAPAADAGAAQAVDYDGDDLDAGASEADTTILLSGESFEVQGAGTSVNGSTLYIVAAGTYRLSGTLDDGRIIIDSEDPEEVRLILDDASLTSSISAPIYVFNAEKTVITLADGTVNSVTDAAAYVLDDPGSGEPDAAIFSNDDLTINGGGTLTVTASCNNGIASDDDLKITGGTIVVNAVNDGLQGRDAIAIKDGSLTVTAGGDGLRANNDEEADQGTVTIEGGSLAITAGADGIQAETTVTISGGTVAISSGGGAGDAVQPAGWGPGPWGDDAAGTDAPDTTDAARGLQAGAGIRITGGSLSVDSADDALHSDGSIVIEGGQVTLAAGDDGLHAETSLTINGGELAVTQSYEGLEGKDITIHDGLVHVVASDDGINASSGAGSGFGFGMGAPGGFGETGDSSLTVNGGTLSVDATGDGLDVNGPIAISGGTVIVNGPTSDGNGPVDYLGSLAVTGGTFLAAGSSGMAQAPTADSTQNSLMITFASAVAAGTVIHVETESGQAVLTFTPIREVESVLFSSAALDDGAACVVYTGGSSSGTAVDGVSTGGRYYPGTELATVTISDVVTYVGSHGGGFFGGPGGQRPPRPGGG